MLYAILVVLLVAADQLVKILVRANIPLGASMPFSPGWWSSPTCRTPARPSPSSKTIPGSSPSSPPWWRRPIAAALIKRVVAHPFGVITLSVVLAGAVGNLIDRALFGFVTDMFNLQFMHFAVFNVADICVVCGGIAFCVYFLFFYDKLEKKEAPDDSHPAEG